MREGWEREIKIGGTRGGGKEKVGGIGEWRRKSKVREGNMRGVRDGKWMSKWALGGGRLCEGVERERCGRNGFGREDGRTGRIERRRKLVGRKSGRRVTMKGWDKERKGEVKGLIFAIIFYLK